MERELKIVISIFLVFFIYGLTSYFNSGSFVTFSFLDNLVLTAVSIFFWILNIKETKSWVLLLYSFVMIIYGLNDQFTAGFLSEKFKSEVFYELAGSTIFNWVNIILFFGFFLGYMIYLFIGSKRYLLFSIGLILIVLTVILLGTDLIYWPHIAMSSFLLFLFIYIQRVNPNPYRLHQTFGAQFLLLFLLTSLHYFS